MKIENLQRAVDLSNDHSLCLRQIAAIEKSEGFQLIGSSICVELDDGLKVGTIDLFETAENHY